MIHSILHFIGIAAGVVFLFGAAIFVHELGHFWVARKRGLKIEEFAIGFGPKMVARVKDGIQYSIRWIPAGGFVKLPQMVTSSTLEGENKGEKLPPVSPFSKILVAVAGPAMNVLFAFFIATVIYFIGLPVSVNPSIIGYVDPASPESKLGIHQGDRIIAVDGTAVKSWEEINKCTFLALTNRLPVTVRHRTEAGADGATETYLLATVTNNALGMKTLNLDPLDHLIVKQVLPGQPAEAAGVRTNDEVVAFAGVPVFGQTQFIDLIQKRGSQPTEILVKRDGAPLTLHVVPATDSSTKKSKVGLMFALGQDVYVIEHPTPLSQVEDVVDQMVKTLTALVHSRQSGIKASDLSGPVGIFGALAVQWSIDYRLALNFLVLLNINLAIINMLPLPVLDGGHILMSVVERVRGRPMGVKFVEYLTTAFAAALLAFMLYITFYDVKRVPLLRSMLKQETQIENPAKTAAPAAPPQAPR